MRRNIIVVLNYNDWEETTRFCNAVKDFQSVDLILIVDNKSSDESVAMLKKNESEKIKLLVADENKGYAAGNNVGLKYILDNKLEGNVIISNPDIYFSDKGLKEILKPLEDSTIGITTGLITTGGKITSNFAWKLPSYWQILMIQSLVFYKLMKITGHSIYLDHPKNDDNIYCECVSGCFFCMTTETLNQIGLMDERTFLLGEENILGYKIRQNKQKVCVVTKERVEHDQHHSIKKSIKKDMQVAKWLLNSQLVYIQYYLNKIYLFKYLFVIFFWVTRIERKLIFLFYNK